MAETEGNLILENRNGHPDIDQEKKAFRCTGTGFRFCDVHGVVG